MNLTIIIIAAVAILGLLVLVYLVSLLVQKGLITPENSDVIKLAIKKVALLSIIPALTVLPPDSLPVIKEIIQIFT